MFGNSNQKGLDVCYCLWGVPSGTLAWVRSWARPGPIPGPKGSRPDSPSACDSAFLVYIELKNPEKLRNPPPRSGPENTKKNTEKKTKTAQSPFSYFFGVFFIFSGPDPGWGLSLSFRIFRISGLEGFWNYIYIYIYILVGWYGAPFRPPRGLIRSPRRADTEAEAKRNFRNATKIGVSSLFLDVRKVAEKFRFGTFFGRVHRTNRNKKTFFWELGLRISSSSSAVSRGWPFSGLGPKSRKRFVSAVIAFGLWRLSWERRGLEKFAKSFGVETKNAQFFFGIHVSDTFGSGWVFLRCGARFWACRRRGECHFGPLHAVSGPHCAVVLPAAPCVCGLTIPLSLRFGEVVVGHLATRGVLAAEPRVVTPDFRLWLRFRGVLRGHFATCGLCNLIGPETPRNCGN